MSVYNLTVVTDLFVTAVKLDIANFLSDFYVGIYIVLTTVLRIEKKHLQLLVGRIASTSLTHNYLNAHVCGDISDPTTWIRSNILYR